MNGKSWIEPKNKKLVREYSDKSSGEINVCDFNFFSCLVMYGLYNVISISYKILQIILPTQGQW